MRVVIAGCGRVGSALATRLTAEHHDVAVIDRDPKARRLLPDAFTGQFFEGSAFNRELLDAAGTGQADAFVAVTSADNPNLVAARTAKDAYRVPVVMARLQDPRRADLYRELAIPTTAAVSWTVHQIHQALLHRHLDPELSFGSGETLLVRSRLPGYLAGRRLDDLDVDSEIRVVEVTRSGRSQIPQRGSTAEADDLVTFAVAAGSLTRLRGFLDRELGT